jgi:hypothetical protein
MKYLTRFFQPGNSYFAAMNDTVSKLVKSVFQKESLHDCTLEELQIIARQYPYFTPAQFLLAEKLKSTDGNLHKEQMQKLSLYFNNPLWLDYLANGVKKELIVEPQTEGVNAFYETTTIEEKQKDSELVEEAPVSIDQETEVVEPAEEKINEDGNLDSFYETTTVEEKQEDSKALTEEAPINIERETGLAEPVEEKINEPLNENVNSFTDLPTIEEKQEDSETVNEEALISIESETEIPQSVEEEINEPLNENVNSFNETITEEEQQHIEIPNEEILTIIESESKTTEPTEDENIKSEISIPHLPDLKQGPTETELTFEPYHTVDYFASQGIKFVPEEKPADRFGQQLKSFTEWLKTMKRLPETETAKIPDVALEEKVQQLADHSISEGEVVTETMAEVWLKQGNKEKAIETYNKLSLLNPGKSAYFASLIEQLKNS